MVSDSYRERDRNWLSEHVLIPVTKRDEIEGDLRFREFVFRLSLVTEQMSNQPDPFLNAHSGKGRFSHARTKAFEPQLFVLRKIRREEQLHRLVWSTRPVPDQDSSSSPSVMAG